MNPLEERSIESILYGIRRQIGGRGNQLKTNRTLPIDSVAVETGINIDFTPAHCVTFSGREGQILQPHAANRSGPRNSDHQTCDEDCATHLREPPLFNVREE